MFRLNLSFFVWGKTYILSSPFFRGGGEKKLWNFHFGKTSKQSPKICKQTLIIYYGTLNIDYVQSIKGKQKSRIKHAAPLHLHSEGKFGSMLIFVEHSYVHMSKALQKHFNFPWILTNILYATFEIKLSMLFVATWSNPTFNWVEIYYFLRFVFIVFVPLSTYANMTFCQWMLFTTHVQNEHDLHQISVRNFQSTSFLFCSIHYIRSPHSKRSRTHVPNVNGKGVWKSCVQLIWFAFCFEPYMCKVFNMFLSHMHRGNHWFKCAPSWCEKLDLKQF